MTESAFNNRKTFGFLSEPLMVAAVFAVVKLAVHFYANGSYGYFRDELYFLACGEHLAWGYPDHSPLVAVYAWFSRRVFGESLFAIRLLSALAGAGKILLTGLLVKEFGGRAFAAFLACLCVLFAPVYLGIDNLLSMNSFEPLFWMGCVAAAVLAINRNDSRWWVLFGLLAGLGLMNKHSMAFFGLAVVVGLLLTPARRFLFDKWIWIGGAIAFLIFLPNIIWQIQNSFATLELLQNVQQTGKNVVLAPGEFVSQQIFIMLPTTAPVWLAGLWWFLADKNGRRFRFLGIAYLVTLALMIWLKAKDYYLAPIYPMLFAAGAIWWEQTVDKLRALRLAKVALPLLVVGLGLVAMPMPLSVLPIETYLRYQNALGFKPPKSEVAHDSILPQHYADQFGWREMVERVAGVYNSLPPEERQRTAIYGSNYGQAGAVDFWADEYGLPKAISPHQSYFVWGHRGYTGETTIILGGEREEAEQYFNSVEETVEVGHPYAMSYEKYKILICRGIKKPLPEMWQSLKYWN